MGIRKVFSMQARYNMPEGPSNPGNLLTVTDGFSNLGYAAATGDWVRFVISWDSFQHDDPGAAAKSDPHAFWDSLDASPGWDYLDRQVSMAIQYGMYPQICVNCDGTPPWAANPDAVSQYNSERPPIPASRIVPASVDSNSPYAWFLSYLCARYKYGIPAGRVPSPYGGLLWGNPYGAFMYNLEPLNEPNYLWYPQILYTSSGSSAIAECMTAQAMQTAELALYSWGAPPGYYSGLVGPSTADNPTSTTTLQTAYDQFTQSVLQLLANANPRVPYAWSLHNYSDMRRYVTVPGEPKNARLNKVISLMDATPVGGPWHGRTIMVTEGGFAMSSTESETLQASAVQDGLANTALLFPRVWTQAQHSIVSERNTPFDSGTHTVDPGASYCRERPSGAAWDAVPKAGAG